MLLEVIKAVAIPAYKMMAHPGLHSLGTPVVERASLSIPDTLFLFVVALVVFGPKRLPEIGKQIGKLVFEFRRASNDFKLQIEEELRVSDQQEKQKKLEMQAAAAVAAPPLAIAAEATTVSAPIAESGAAGNAPEEKGLVVQPPSSGTMVEATPPHRFRTAPQAEVEAPKVEEPGIEPAEVQKMEAGLEQSTSDAPTEGAPTQHG